MANRQSNTPCSKSRRPSEESRVFLRGLGPVLLTALFAACQTVSPEMTTTESMANQAPCAADEMACEQIIEAQGLGDGLTESGCSVGAMDNWVKLVN